MAGPIFPISAPLVAAIRSLREAHRARLLVIFWLGATGLVSVPFATEAQALGLVDAAGGCVACPAASAAAAPYSGQRDSGYPSGPLAYATPGNDVVRRTENAITINDARPFAAPTQIRLHRFLQPYEVIKQIDRDAVGSRINQAAPNKKRPARLAPPPPKDIGVTGTTGSTFAALPPVFTPVQSPLNPAPADAAKDQNVGIVSAHAVNSIDLAADPRAPGQATSMTASLNVSPQALSVIAGALAGVAVGLFLISWLQIGRDLQVR
jgi:hypothetical protein